MEITKALQAQVELAKKANAALATHFKTAADHHTAMAKVHGEAAAFYKGKSDSMADDHDMKDCMGKAAGHHEGLSTLHKAQADHCSAMAGECDKSAKAAGAPELVVTEIKKCAHQKAMTEACTDCKRETPTPEAAAGDAVKNMVDKTIAGLMAKSLETVATSGEIEKMVEKIVIERVNAQLGGKLVPTDARSVLDFDLAPRLVPRDGQKSVEKTLDTEIDSDFVELFRI